MNGFNMKGSTGIKWVSFVKLDVAVGKNSRQSVKDIELIKVLNGYWAWVGPQIAQQGPNFAKAPDFPFNI